MIIPIIRFKSIFYTCPGCGEKQIVQCKCGRKISDRNIFYKILMQIIAELNNKEQPLTADRKVTFIIPDEYLSFAEQMISTVKDLDFCEIKRERISINVSMKHGKRKINMTEISVEKIKNGAKPV